MKSARKILLAAAAVSLAAVLATPAAAQSFKATLDGTQEVPPNTSPGRGIGCFELSTDLGYYYLNYDISFAGLVAPETAAHIHGPAGPGVAAGVIIPLPVGSPKVGFIAITLAQYNMIGAGLTYVNVHSTAYPGGEIRGQILPGVCGPVPVNDTTWGAVKALYR